MSRRVPLDPVEPHPRTTVFIDGVEVGEARQVNVSRDMHEEMGWQQWSGMRPVPGAVGAGLTQGPALVDGVEQDWSGRDGTKISFRGPRMRGEVVIDEVGISPQARGMGQVLGRQITIQTTQEMSVREVHEFRDFFETGDAFEPPPGPELGPLELLDRQVEEVASAGRGW